MAGGLRSLEEAASQIKSIDPNEFAPIDGRIGEGSPTGGHASAQPGTSQGHHRVRGWNAL